MIVAAVLVGLVVTTAEAEPEHRIGIGAYYWHVINDIDVRDVDERGLAWYASYQFKPTLLIKIEAELELLPEGYGGAGTEVYAPQVMFVLGGGAYAAAGVGMYYADSQFVQDPFYTLRMGLDFHIFPVVRLDLNASYRFENWDGLNELEDDLNSDTMKFGAAVRVEL